MQTIDNCIQKYFVDKNISIGYQDCLLNALNEYIRSEGVILPFHQDKQFYSYFHGLKHNLSSYESTAKLESIERIYSRDYSQKITDKLWEDIKQRKKKDKNK